MFLIVYIASYLFLAIKYGWKLLLREINVDDQPMSKTEFSLLYQLHDGKKLQDKDKEENNNGIFFLDAMPLDVLGSLF